MKPKAKPIGLIIVPCSHEKKFCDCEMEKIRDEASHTFDDLQEAIAKRDALEMLDRIQKKIVPYSGVQKDSIQRIIQQERRRLNGDNRRT